MTQATCPSCGSQIVFKLGSSIVVVCAHCNSAVARTDRDIKDLGKVAALVDTNSPLKVGLQGNFGGMPFELTGRAQIKHQLGGLWDEWYAHFSDGGWGWLAEAQGKYYITFPKQLDGTLAFDQFAVGEAAPACGAGYIVAEMGVGAYAGAEGEIPFELTPGEQYQYADLVGPENRFATVDFGPADEKEDKPLFFAGHETTLALLGIKPASEQEPAQVKQVKTAAVSCPKCAGALELRAPDHTQRVGCPYCGALLDCTQGNLKFLEALDVKGKPVLPLGKTAEFDGVTMTVIGFAVRSVTIEGTKYFWHEYLLYGVPTGFRWLVHSDNHWTYVEPVHIAAVTKSGNDMLFRKRTFKRFQDAQAVVEYVVGEFYWKVSVGETVTASDFVSPPEMLSCEVSGDAKSGEVNWSLGSYVPVAVIEKKFGVTGLPKPSTVGACQPFPHRGVYRWFGWFLLIATVMVLLVHLTSPERVVFDKAVDFPAAQNAEAGQVFFSEPFNLEGNKNLLVKGHATANNSWVFLEGDLIHEESGTIQPFELPIEYYHGVEDGEAWSEGGPDEAVFLAAVPAGKYTLRLALTQSTPGPAHVNVTVVQGVARWINDVLLLLALAVIPLFVLIWEQSFESSRWKESMYGPSSGDDE
jgi:hypothetical protein